MAGTSKETRCNRVLIVRAGALGDTLMVTPLIRRLHEDQPDREIHILCSPGGAALLRSNEHLSKIYTLRNRNVPYFFSSEKRALVRELRANGYPVAILLESASRYRQLLERARIPDIRSFAEVPFQPAQHSVINNLRVGGFADTEAATLRLDLKLTNSARQTAARLMAGLPAPRIGMHAGYGPAGKKGSQSERLRGWKISNFREVAYELSRAGASIILTGSAEDRSVCHEIASGLPSRNIRVIAGGTSVEELAAVIASLDLFISVDSGPAHIATALCIPLIVLWGPGILSQTGPLSPTAPVRILNANVPCAPCYGTQRMKECRRNVCMEQIKPNDVIAQALSLLSLKSSPATAPQAGPEVAR